MTAAGVDLSSRCSSTSYSAELASASCSACYVSDHLMLSSDHPMASVHRRSLIFIIFGCVTRSQFSVDSPPQLTQRNRFDGVYAWGPLNNQWRACVPACHFAVVSISSPMKCRVGFIRLRWIGRSARLCSTSTLATFTLPAFPYWQPVFGLHCGACRYTLGGCHSASTYFACGSGSLGGGATVGYSSLFSPVVTDYLTQRDNVAHMAPCQ